MFPNHVHVARLRVLLGCKFVYKGKALPNERWHRPVDHNAALITNNIPCHLAKGRMHEAQPIQCTGNNGQIVRARSNGCANSMTATGTAVTTAPKETITRRHGFRHSLIPQRYREADTSETVTHRHDIVTHPNASQQSKGANCVGEWICAYTHSARNRQVKPTVWLGRLLSSHQLHPQRSSNHPPICCGL